MLIDQIRIITDQIPDTIEKIIYEIQAYACNGVRSWQTACKNHETSKKIVDYFTKEGFTVETLDTGPDDKFFPDSTVITISW